MTPPLGIGGNTLTSAIAQSLQVSAIADIPVMSLSSIYAIQGTFDTLYEVCSYMGVDLGRRQ